MIRKTCFILTSMAVTAGAAWAQPAEEASHYRTAISAVGGLSVGSSGGFEAAGFRFGGDGAGAAVGGSIAHDLSPRLTMEATGLYLDRASGAWSADLGFRLNLRPSRESIVPYFAVSGGVFSESGRDGLRGLLDERGGNRFPVLTPVLPGRGGRSGTLPGAGLLPPGVADQVSNLLGEGSRSTDGMMTLGGGAVFSAGPHVFVRPDIRAQLVFSGDTRVLGLFALNFGYRF